MAPSSSHLHSPGSGLGVGEGVGQIEAGVGALTTEINQVISFNVNQILDVHRTSSVSGNT